MGFIVLLGRIFFATIFIVASIGHFTAAEIKMGADSGVPLANLLVPAAGAMAFLGGLSVLLGYKARIGAWLLVLFLVPVTLAMHRFWGLTDANLAVLQMTMFLKNLSMLGGALLITHFGAGPWSFDARQ